MQYYDRIKYYGTPPPARSGPAGGRVPGRGLRELRAGGAEREPYRGNGARPPLPTLCNVRPRLLGQLRPQADRRVPGPRHDDVHHAHGRLDHPRRNKVQPVQRKPLPAGTRSVLSQTGPGLREGAHDQTSGAMMFRSQRSPLRTVPGSRRVTGAVVATLTGRSLSRVTVTVRFRPELQQPPLDSVGDADLPGHPCHLVPVA